MHFTRSPSVWVETGPSCTHTWPSCTGSQLFISLFSGYSLQSWMKAVHLMFAFKCAACGRQPITDWECHRRNLHIWEVEALISFRFNKFPFLGNKLHLWKGSRVQSNIPVWCGQASEPAEQPQQSQHLQSMLVFPDHHLCNKAGERWDSEESHTPSK